MSGEESAPDADSEESEPPPLILEGNKPRWLRGGFLTAFGLLLTMFFSMAPATPRTGVPTVAISCAILTLGLLDLIGSFDDPAERVAKRVVLLPLALPAAIATFG